MLMRQHNLKEKIVLLLKLLVVRLNLRAFRHIKIRQPKVHFTIIFFDEK